MKRSTKIVKVAVVAAVATAGIAASVPAFGGAYVTVDLLARPASLNPTKYTNVADGVGGYTDLAGYNATAPGASTNNSFNTTGFSSTITPAATGELYELLVRFTLASQGTTNAFASGGNTVIENWNPSANTVAASGLNSLRFNLTQSTSGVQASFFASNQGPSFNPDPNGDGTAAPSLDTRVILDRGRSAQQTGTQLAWDNGSGSNGGTLVNRGNGSNNVQSVLLIRGTSAGQQYGGIAGTNAAPTTPAINMGLGYFSITALGATSSLAMDFSSFLSSDLLSGIKWRNAADTADVVFNLSKATQDASVAGLDPIIKINALTLAGVASNTPAALTYTPVPPGPVNTGGSVTVTNVAAGGTVDSASSAGFAITPGAATNGTWGAVGTLTTNPAVIAGNGGSASATYSLTGTANVLNNAKSIASSSFTTSAPPGATGTGLQTYTLSAVIGVDVAYVNAVNSGTTSFGTAQTANVATGDTFANLASTEGNGQGTTASFNSKVLTGDATLNVAWRSLSTGESFPGSVPPLPAGINSLISDVANITIAGTAPSAYLIQMTYNEGALAGASESLAFLAGKLYLAKMTDGGGANGDANDQWGLAGVGAPNVANIRPFAIGDLDAIGTYGVDTVNNIAWAVVSGSNQGQFAVVPEPASLGLLALGALGLIRRRK